MNTFKFLIFFIFFSNCLSFGQSINMSNGFVFDGEPFIKINPYNSQHLVIAWMGYDFGSKFLIHTRVSLDGGLTWSDQVTVPHTVSSYSSVDPVLDFLSDETVVLCFIDFDVTIDEGQVVVSRSFDGGFTWESPETVIEMDTFEGKRPIDRPWMATDRSGGIYDGNIYVTSMNLQYEVFTGPPYHPYLSKSENGGESFISSIELDTEDWETGSLIISPMSVPVVGSSGRLHIVYPAWVLSHAPQPRYILATSSDGGETYTYNTMFYVDDAPSDETKKGGYQLVVNPVDESHLVFLYLGNIDGDTDILFRESNDYGITWTDAKKINDDPVGNNRLQDMLWGDFDIDGDLIVTWRDRRNAEGEGYEVGSEFWAAKKEMGEADFLPNFKISTGLVDYDTILESAGNDFMSMQVLNDTIHATWGDTRSGALNIWYGRITTNGELLSIKNLDENDSIVVFPNPSKGDFTFHGNGIIKVTVYDQSGKLILEQATNQMEMINISLPDELTNGGYWIIFEQNSGKILQSFLFLQR